MTALVLVCLAMVCAKLWFDVDALRDRVLAMEGDAQRTWHPDVIDTPLPVERTTVPAPVPVAAPMPAVPPPVIAVVAAPMPPPVVERQPEPAACEAIEAPAAHNGGFEDLFGRKLPIWAGGITLAVAGFLIVKYSIDAGLLSPVVRVIMGILFGATLIAGAEAALRADDRVRDPRVRQALSGAGVATFYASILAAANLYDLIGPMTGFVGMALVTVLAGALSLRFGAPSAVLGLVGGLVAPALVGSGTPDVPLLAAYLALTVGGLCALSRTQRWMWLGVAALTGGFGWGALLLLGGALDLAATLSIGVYTLLLGIALPLIAFRGCTGTLVRLVGSLAACAQLAGLVATGGFGGLHWGLFGLVSVAIVWLARREAALAELPAAGLGIALLLVAAWPDPDAMMLATVLAGIAAIFGGAAGRRVWRRDARLSDALALAAIAFAAVALPAMRLDLGDGAIAALALLGAGVSAVVAALGWRAVGRTDDARFAILVTTTATLIAIAAAILVPLWLLAPVIAAVAAGVLALAARADDIRIDRIAIAFAAAATSTLALRIPPCADLCRAVGTGGSGLDPRAAVAWLVPALMAAAFARYGRLPGTARVAQPIAVLLGYVAAAQLVPTAALPLVPPALLAALTFGRKLTPAILAATALTAGWACAPFATWLAAGGGAILGTPMLVGALPKLDDTALRLALPALAAGLVGWRRPEMRRIAVTIGAVLAGVVLHIGFKQILAIDNAKDFTRLGMAERTLWEMLLAGAAVALWTRMSLIGRVLAATSVAHFGWFTLMLHNPLWSLQSVGPWPVANLLLPAFATAFALTSRARGAPLAPWAVRAREWVQMTLILAFAAATLRHAFHGSLLSVGAVGEGEDIARSVLLIALGIGFLRHGISAAARDWRIASLGLMLIAVAKVFLVDAAGLDGLLRIASFAALGFSLIGIGWLYARYLPDDATALTARSETPAMPNRGN